jgi:hypothetical protein
LDVSGRGLAESVGVEAHLEIDQALRRQSVGIHQAIVRRGMDVRIAILTDSATRQRGRDSTEREK